MNDNISLDIAAGITGLLVAKNIGVWEENGVYEKNTLRPPIFIGRLPAEPLLAIGVTPYVASMDTKLGVDIRAVQIRLRNATSDPRPVIDLADRLEDLLHGRENLTFGSYPIPLIWRHSLSVLGAGETNNYQITDNYYMYVDTKSL
ncbi:minor capsid protein [Auritidibacter ignavus]|uniref:Minor capsid protein n=1 Tax=Auritidibacter ignavus TaxID=678932 RepID=A0AAJ6ALP3_9MICC|nr:minor capsid protein [Auritidibacter ignavus]WGH92094.1 minor capsid protein [Auritidibacter ignavus]